MAKLVLTWCIITALLWPLTALAKELSRAEVLAMNAAVEAVCPLIEQRAGLEQQIELERKNPAGVVSLRRLHELGELLQFTRAELARAEAEHRDGLEVFRSWAGKPLDLGFCAAWSRDHE